MKLIPLKTVVVLLASTHVLLSATATPPPAAQAGNPPATTGPRQATLLSDAPWQFIGAKSMQDLPKIQAPDFSKAAWETVTVPHVFQTRQHFLDLNAGWYRRSLAVPPELAGHQLYLVFEGAAAIADIYVNGQYLGQHRGAYTRFVFNATQALKQGSQNELAVLVNNDVAETTDCLPDNSRLYKVSCR